MGMRVRAEAVCCKAGSDKDNWVAGATRSVLAPGLEDQTLYAQ